MISPADSAQDAARGDDMTETMQKKLILIDGHSIINRAFYGMPDLTNSKGVHTGAVYGFLNILFRILDEEKADYLIVAFDEHAPTFRHEMYAAYKGTRKPMPEELRTQVPLLRRVLTAMGVEQISRAGIEADDILGTCAKKAEREGMTVSLVSGDRDLLQVATDKICVRIPKTVRGQTTIENYHPADVSERYQITPRQVIEIKGLMGDTADNIPGVPKVGEKTAHQLIGRYGSVDGVYAHLDEITRKSLRENLENYRDQAYLSLDLATIRTDLDLPIDWEKAAIGNFYTREAYAIFTELNFKAFLPRFDDAAAAGAAADRREETEASGQSIQEIRDRSEAEDAFAVIKGQFRRAEKGAPAVAGLYLLEEGGRLYAAAVSIPGTTYYFVPDHTEMEEGMSSGEKSTETEAEGKSEAPDCGERNKKVLTDGERYLEEKLGQLRTLAGSGEGRIFCGFDYKSLYPYLDIRPQEEFRQGIHLNGLFDALLGCYLLNPLKSDYTAEDCLSEYAGLVPPAFVQMFGKKSVSEAFRTEPAKAGQYACAMADGLRRAAPALMEKLREEDMWDLYDQMELPLSYILYDMQRIGIRILPQALKDYSRELGEQAAELEQRIYQETGTEFNISSPKQLGQVLFEKMKLPGGKKTKTGWSTAADVLNRLAPDCPAVRDILEYRAVTKLKSTYADGLADYIGPDSRIHTVFHQTITATGRISSSDPNLQNIPMRTEMGRLIRKAFVPGEGYSFTDSDYSQIELRILASMSGDEELIKAYRENRDIHRITASKVFHVPFDEVTPLQRRNAKAVNFGIVYGISAFGLAENIDIPRSEAQKYIDSYFETYPGIRTYLDSCVREAKERGYSLTLFHRRRPIPELKNSNFMTRQFGERVAMNAPIQGTAADIMKIAMIRVWERLLRENRASRLILQIHDELLVETAPGEEDAVRTILSEEMTGAADLPVRLETDVHSGSDWYEAK